ncbi:FecCD family ABC transporter permease [Catenulispora yoronensis]|uniref:FecCD family ABC transporter permease n=1 Tax=Catenulispora yoronensis TaxID=450799 RepID=UPI003CD055BA
MGTVEVGDLRSPRQRSRTGPRGRRRARTGTVCLALALTAVAAAVFALGSGDYHIAATDVIKALTGGGDAGDRLVVRELRLPRVATALAAGAALALAGAISQSMVRNPLGSPDMLGFTQGASTGALVVVVVAGGGSAALAGGAVVGGAAAGILIFALARHGGMHGNRLVMVGIGVTAILTGVNSYLLTKAQLTDAARAMLWLTGSLDGRGWNDAAPVLVGLALATPAAALGLSRSLRMLELGDDAAHALGVRTAGTRILALTCTVLLSALAAAAAGPVAFVALTAPQLARRLTRAPGPNLLPSALLGSALLVVSDWLAQHAVPGRQVPAGVVTGLFGGCYLIWLLAVGQDRRRT